MNCVVYEVGEWTDAGMVVLALTMSAGTCNNALLNNTSGSGNTASGTNALAFNATGSYNIAIGFAAGSSLATQQSALHMPRGGPGLGGRRDPVARCIPQQWRPAETAYRKFSMSF
jgi:hypothetical protein